MQAGHTGFDAIVRPVPGGASFVPAPVTGRLPRTSREIALGARTLRQLHTRIGATIGVSVQLGTARARPTTIVGTTVFPTLSDALGLGTGAALTLGGLRHLLPARAAIPPPAARRGVRPVPAGFPGRRQATQRSPRGWPGSGRSR